MHALQTTIAIAWIAFWAYWLTSAVGMKESTGGRRGFRGPGLSALSVIVLFRVFRGGSLSVHSPALGAGCAVLFASGIGLAVWARVNLGRNWGMPMTQKAEPELVTSGPYRLVRHPIYSGILLAMLGTALVTSVLGLIAVVIVGGYFYYSAAVEEGNLTKTFATAYPVYRSRTKMLIPYIL